MQLITEGGYLMGEVASALQKEIRRGNEEEAMFWAIELESRYHAYLWFRLTIIASEDIGPADSSVSVLIHSLRQDYEMVRSRSKRPAERIILAHAIIALCRAEKSRLADDLAALIGHRRESEGIKPEIPDYALDSHTQKGRAMGRDWDFWAEEGLKLHPESSLPNPYRDRALALRKKHGRLYRVERVKPAGRRKKDEELFE